MNDIKNNTILGEDLFSYDFRNSLIMHIPHSSVSIPDRKQFLLDDDELNKEILKLTDIGTDVIFDLGFGVTHQIFKYNRVYCDVERLPDEQEEMFQFGRGFFYTKTDDGRDLRNENPFKGNVKFHYDRHHKRLENSVRNKLQEEGVATIIDCHSFSDTPFETDLIKEDDRPDICLGTDDFHTPDWLIKRLTAYFEGLGYSVKINNPYGGTIVPLKYYKKDVNVLSIMIEVNRKLFTCGANIEYDKLLELNKVMKKMFD
jgi:N-formylglutamate amidohydrolase